MKALRNYLNKIKPNFEKEGKLHAFRSIFDGFETFLYVPNTTAKTGVSIHDAIDSKRIMSFVVIALMPAMLFGMYNVGYQNAVASGIDASFWEMFIFGFFAVLPKIIVSYVVGLGIEFAWAQWKGEEIQEGYLVSGILIPLIVPVGCPLWMLALACAFSVIFCKEIFGGTGMNIFNPAIAARMFLFFSYPSVMTGDKVWVADSPCGYGQTRQAYLACLKAGVLDMIRTWSEAGRMDDIRKVLDNVDRLNETYRQYVCAREDLPYIVKYADFDERLMVQTDDTEFGRVTCLKAVNLEDIGGAARRCVSAPWRRVTRELKLVDG